MSAAPPTASQGSPSLRSLELTSLPHLYYTTTQSAAELAVQIQDNFDAVMAKPPGSKGDPAEVAALRKRIHEDQTLLIQWAEEKVQLAIAGHDMVKSFEIAIQKDVVELSTELQKAGLMDGEYEMDDYGMETLPAPELPGRRGGSRLQYAASYDSLEPTPILETRPAPVRKAAAAPGMSRQQSGYGSEGGYGAGSDMLGWEAPKRGGGSSELHRCSVGGEVLLLLNIKKSFR